MPSIGLNYKVAAVSILPFMSLLAVFWLWQPYQQKERSVLIGFAGDTMLGRLVNEVIDQYDYAYPWGNMLPLLLHNDLNLINLETTLTQSERKVPKVFNFKALPDRVECLTIANIDMCCLANNHILDFNVEGLTETIATLNNADIKHVGAGQNIDQAKKPVIIKQGDIKLGIIGYTDNEPTWQATDDKPGVNYINIGDIEKVKNQIVSFKDEVDLVIVSIHWGPNMQERPSDDFIAFAHAMIDAGVDIIHGHSAHIFQGIEIYNNKLIMYDTGDFVDDYAVDPILRNDRSFLFLVTVDKTGIKQLKLVPTKIDHMQVNQATGKDYDWCMQRIQKLSAPFGTHISDNGIITF